MKSACIVSVKCATAFYGLNGRLTCVVLKVCLLLLFLASCTKGTEPAIELNAAYMEALAPQQESAPVFMRIRNNSAVSQSLNYVHTPVAGYVEIHRTMYHQGDMKMRQMQRVNIQPGETEHLSSKGYHLMLMGIYDNLPTGSVFDLTLEFDSGEVVTVQVDVRSRR